MGRPGSLVVARSSAAMFDSPSPARGDRIAEFPDSPPPVGRRPLSPSYRFKERRLRSSVGSSDLTKSRQAFRDSVDDDDADLKEHFTVHTIMVNHKETRDSVRHQDMTLPVVGGQWCNVPCRKNSSTNT